MTVPDPLEATVKIPVRIVNGAPVLLYGGALPTLKEGVVGDLVLPAFAVLDQEMLAQLSRKLRGPVLRSGTVVRAAITPSPLDRAVSEPSESERNNGMLTSYCEIILEEDLELTLRGTKRAVLRPCRCTVPALGIVARSVNQAYSRLSERFEQARVSHTGNVFALVYFRDRRDGKWCPLERLREPLEALIEQQVATLVQARTTAP